MQVSFPKSVILQAVGIAAEFGNAKFDSALSCLLIQAHDGITVTATDTKQWFRATLDGMVLQPGSALINIGKLREAIAGLPNGIIFIDAEENQATVKGETKAKVKINTIAVSNFPEITPTVRQYSAIITGGLYLTVLGHCIASVSDDESRYFMTGLFIKSADKKTDFVATDGRRLSMVSTSEDLGIPGIIVPPRILKAAAKLIKPENQVAIFGGDKFLSISFRDFTFSTILIEGQFPNYLRVIPKKQDFSASFLRQDMTRAVQLASVSSSKSMRVFIDLDKDAAHIHAEDKSGESSDDVEIGYDGPEMKLGMNYTFLIDALSSITDDSVKMLLTSPNKAVSINGIQDDYAYSHIIMPMQVE